MSEKESNNTASVVERISNSEGLGDFGYGIGKGIALVAFFLMVPLMLFATKWDGKFHEDKQCYEFKEIKEKLFKLNTCTGEMEEIESKQKST